MVGERRAGLERHGHQKRISRQRRSQCHKRRLEQVLKGYQLPEPSHSADENCEWKKAINFHINFFACHRLQSISPRCFTYSWHKATASTTFISWDTRWGESLTSLEFVTYFLLLSLNLFSGTVQGVKWSVKLVDIWGKSATERWSYREFMRSIQPVRKRVFFINMQISKIAQLSELCQCDWLMTFSWTTLHDWVACHPTINKTWVSNQFPEILSCNFN